MAGEGRRVPGGCAMVAKDNTNLMTLYLYIILLKIQDLN